MVTLVDELISDPTQEGTQDGFAQSLKEVLDGIHSMQAALTAESPDYHTSLVSEPQQHKMKCTYTRHLQCSNYIFLAIMFSKEQIMDWRSRAIIMFSPGNIYANGRSCT